MNLFAGMAEFLSGSFMAPVFFALLGLIPVVILLYLLKLRRTEIVIPSTLLWKKSVLDMTANAPFQRLRKSLLMFLQILVLLLIVFALARPFFKAKSGVGRRLCIIIDRSASMQAREGGTMRLDLAKKEALAMVDKMRGGDKIMVAAFAEKTDVLSEFTDDRARLRQAIKSIEAHDTRTRIRDVMFIARSLSPDNPDVPKVIPDLELVVLSDGDISDLKDLGALASGLSFIKIGESSNNAGIVTLSARAASDDEQERQGFVMVHNESDKALSTTLSLYVDDELAGVREVEADPRSDAEVVFNLPEMGNAMLRAELDGKDDLDVDNRAWLALRPPASIKVLVVAEDESMGAYFLKRALRLDPRVELSTQTPQNYAPGLDHDLVIFDGFAPDVPPAGNLVFINAVPALSGISSAGSLDNPPVLAGDPEHPVMRFINPANIRVGKAMKLAVPKDARTLMSTTGGPLIADVSRGGQGIVVVAFDLALSNWPLRLSFPLFIQNLLAWTPVSSTAGQMSMPTGSALAIMPRQGYAEAVVKGPGGEKQTITLDPLRPVYFGATEKAGPYTVAYGDEIEQYAVNLLDREESSITPSKSLAVGRAEVPAQTASITQNREIWRWLLLLAIMVLSLEWWIYSRRAWI